MKNGNIINQILLSVLALLICFGLFILAMSVYFAPARTKDPGQKPATAEKTAPAIGETVEIYGPLGWRMMPIDWDTNCWVGTGGAVRLVAQRDDYVMIECSRFGDIKTTLVSCPTGTRAVISLDDYQAQKRIQADSAAEFREEQKRRAAEKLFKDVK